MEMDNNDINIRQNTKEILLYLFAQRKLYSGLYYNSGHDDKIEA